MECGRNERTVTAWWMEGGMCFGRGDCRWKGKGKWDGMVDGYLEASERSGEQES